MKCVDAENKELLKPDETIKCFNLSSRKFRALLKDVGDNDFIVMYRTRKLIIRERFAKYLADHPELRKWGCNNES